MDLTSAEWSIRTWRTSNSLEDGMAIGENQSVLE
jgi:hypothetical protein